MSTLPDRGYLPTDAGSVLVRAVGSGPPLIICHGGPGFEHSYLFDWLSPLAAHRTLVFYDQDGCGCDPTPCPQLTAGGAVRQLRALVAAVGGTCPVGVFAHSWGTCLLLGLLGDPGPAPVVAQPYSGAR